MEQYRGASTRFFSAVKNRKAESAINQLGYVLTLAGGSRVLFMVLILPVIIKFCRRNPPKRSTETDQVTSVEEEELAAGVGDADMLAHELHKSKVLHDSRNYSSFQYHRLSI